MGSMGLHAAPVPPRRQPAGSFRGFPEVTGPRDIFLDRSAMVVALTSLKLTNATDQDFFLFLESWLLKAYQYTTDRKNHLETRDP